MNKKKVLLIEDTEDIFYIVSRSLSSEVELLWSANLKDAKKLIDEINFDLFLVDIQLPDGSGIDLCTEIQVQSKTKLIPVVFLTASDTLSEKVLGFSAGATDYIVKPFEPLELKARVLAQLRKTELLRGDQDVLKWDGIEINKSRQEVFINGKKVDLTNLEFKILLYLANHPHDVVDREDLLNEIWGRDVHVYSRSVDTHVSKLRKKIQPADEVIVSVHGVGYKFDPLQSNNNDVDRYLH